MAGGGGTAASTTSDCQPQGHDTPGTLEPCIFILPRCLLDDWFLDSDHLSPQGGGEHLCVCEKTR